MGLLALFGFPYLYFFDSLLAGLVGISWRPSCFRADEARDTCLDENKEGYQGEIVGAVKFENVGFGYVGRNVRFTRY